MREQIPGVLALFTGIEVAGGFPPALGNVGSQVLDTIRVAVAGALAMFVIVVAVLLPIQARVEKLKASKAVPRPRVQYLLISVCWLCLSGCLAVGGSDAGSGYLSRACLALTLWFGVFGLAMLGRAACWGRLRNLFWWLGPTWLANKEPPTANTEHQRARTESAATDRRSQRTQLNVLCFFSPVGECG